MINIATYMLIPIRVWDTVYVTPTCATSTSQIAQYQPTVGLLFCAGLYVI